MSGIAVRSFDGITPSNDRSKVQLWFTTSQGAMFLEMATNEIGKNLLALNQLCASPSGQMATGLMDASEAHLAIGPSGERVLSISLPNRAVFSFQLPDGCIGDLAAEIALATRVQNPPNTVQ